jgi:hypothetical protein
LTATLDALCLDRISPGGFLPVARQFILRGSQHEVVDARVLDFLQSRGEIERASILATSETRE